MTSSSSSSSSSPSLDSCPTSLPRIGSADRARERAAKKQALMAHLKRYVDQQVAIEVDLALRQTRLQSQLQLELILAQVQQLRRQAATHPLPTATVPSPPSSPPLMSARSLPLFDSRSTAPIGEQPPSVAPVSALVRNAPQHPTEVVSVPSSPSPSPAPPPPPLQPTRTGMVRMKTCVDEFLVPGTYDWPVPAHARDLVVTIGSGGGAGANAVIVTAPQADSMPGGGGASGVCSKLVVAPELLAKLGRCTLKVFVGAGGEPVDGADDGKSAVHGGGGGSGGAAVVDGQMSGVATLAVSTGGRGGTGSRGGAVGEAQVTHPCPCARPPDSEFRVHTGAAGQNGSVFSAIGGVGGSLSAVFATSDGGHGGYGGQAVVVRAVTTRRTMLTDRHRDARTESDDDDDNDSGGGGGGGGRDRDVTGQDSKRIVANGNDIGGRPTSSREPADESADGGDASGFCSGGGGGSLILDADGHPVAAGRGGRGSHGFVRFTYVVPVDLIL